MNYINLMMEYFTAEAWMKDISCYNLGESLRHTAEGTLLVTNHHMDKRSMPVF